MTQKTRNWCFTLNNWTEEQCATIATYTNASYILYGKETAPETLTPHLQGMVILKNAGRLSSMKEFLPTAHWEMMKGTTAQSIIYCSKEGAITEWGKRPMSQKEKGDAGKLAIAERWQLAKEGRMEELPPEMIKTYEYIHAKYGHAPTDRTELDNIWIWGPSGCGKSKYVRDTYPNLYIKGMNKWWDGYAQEETVVLDDYDPKHTVFLAYFLKIWADHYVIPAEVKGGKLSIRPKTIIITSQYSMEECFPETNDRQALMRRFRIIDMNTYEKLTCKLLN